MKNQDLKRFSYKRNLENYFVELYLLGVFTTLKMKFSIRDFFSKCDQKTADLLTFIEEIINKKPYFFGQ